MATTTSKLGLTKPDGADLVDVAVLNTNFDKLDTSMGATICTSTTRPSTPYNGQFIYETDTANVLVYKTATTSWTIVSGATVSDTAPVSAGNGSFWWDKASGKLYIYYNDGNSSQWVSAMPSDVNVQVSQNYIINGGFDFWQRGTSFTTSGTFHADRWRYQNGATGFAVTCTKQTFTPGSEVIPGITNYYRLNVTTAGTGATYHQLDTPIEDASTLAGQVVTISFWAKADSSRTLGTDFSRNYGSGGSSTDWALVGTGTHSLTTSWQKFSRTVTIPNISGKTIGSGSSLSLILSFPLNTVCTIDITGVQLEAGPVASNFRRNANSLQGELAACQRYFIRYGNETLYSLYGNGYVESTSLVWVGFALPVTMRIPPSVSITGSSTLSIVPSGGQVSSYSVDANVNNSRYAVVKIVPTGTPTAYQTALLRNNGVIASYVDWSAEL